MHSNDILSEHMISLINNLLKCNFIAKSEMIDVFLHYKVPLRFDVSSTETFVLILSPTKE